MFKTKGSILNGYFPPVAYGATRVLQEIGGTGVLEELGDRARRFADDEIR